MSRVEQICERLLFDSHALSIVLLGAEGREIAAAGDAELLDANAALSFLAANGKAISDLIADKELAGHLHRAENRHIHLSAIERHAVLIVLFDNRSSLGLVRLRVKKAAEELARLLVRDTPGSGGAPPASPSAGSSGSVVSAQIDDADEPLH
jgi:predicted regulator of Ras-like GTPase activity (Roadblock/LC7/MglB family)